MAIEPVKIPQNVYVEDRIIGPITLKQIMIVLGSSGLSYALWAMTRSAGGVQSILAWIPTFIGVIFAFVKINGISLFRIVLLLIERIDKPARRVWMPRQGIYINIVTKKEPTKEDTKHARKTAQESQIEELSRVLDQGPPEETDVAEIKPVRPERIQANKLKKPVDDIKKNSDQPNTFPGGLMRDISPPPSHA